MNNLKIHLTLNLEGVKYDDLVTRSEKLGFKSIGEYLEFLVKVDLSKVQINTPYSNDISTTLE